MKTTRGLGILFLAIPFFAYSCATMPPQQVLKAWERPEACQEFLARLDATVAEARVRDAATYPIPGFPYLRGTDFFRP